MSLLEALLFGAIQGLTEFLPISSSAHLKLAKMLFSIEPSDSQVLFDLICHLGTLSALLFCLKDELKQILFQERHKLLLLFTALIPLVPAYFLLKPLRDIASHPSCLGLCLLATAVILFSSHKIRFRKMPPTTKSQQIQASLWIGTLQSAALIPGISRSASTICCARALGWTAQEAVRFSFLLSIPTIIGGNCLELFKMYMHHSIPTSLSLSTCLVGLSSALLTGLLVVKAAIRFLEKGNLKPFAWYCLILGIAVCVYLNL